MRDHPRFGSSRGPCAISTECGGCALIDEEQATQLRAKLARVSEAFCRHSELDGVDISDCIAAPEPLEYRNRAKLAVVSTGGAVRLGLYRRGTNEVVDLGSCVVTKPVLRRGLERLRAWLARHALARPQGPVFYVDLRACAGDRCHLTLVIDDRGVSAPAFPLDSLIEAWPELVGIALNEGDSASSFPLGPRTRILVGDSTFDAFVPTDDGSGVELSVPVGGFFQVATSLLPDVHRRMRAHLQGPGRLYDLYSGVGVHGLLIERPPSGTNAGIFGIEESPSAVAAAERNSHRLGLDASYRAGRVEDVLPAALARSPARRFVLNPARAGCKPGVLDALLGVVGVRIAYLSCDPTTLARDLAVLVRGGLRARQIIPFDLMPQTDQVETLALIA